MKKILIAVTVLALAACAEKKGNTDGATDGGAQNSATPNTDVINNPATPQNPAAASDPANSPAISFENTHVTVEPITEGESIEIVYTFTNTGNAPLVLKAVQPTCGCTVTDDWPKEPIAPGAKGKIKAVYNSKDRGTGSITKNISVQSNAPYPGDVTDLKFTVQVNPKKG
ncbi:MAG: DUF1573 domain-containing protein [Bacteroidetes bacterium]|nr:MAG: DUF1573 domain-containing protein [Bacteroidota bacterium]